jgi:hypothetical protein
MENTLRSFLLFFLFLYPPSHTPCTLSFAQRGWFPLRTAAPLRFSVFKIAPQAIVDKHLATVDQTTNPIFYMTLTKINQ